MIPIIASPRSALRSRGPHSELSEAQPRFWPVLWLLLDPGCGQGWVGVGLGLRPYLDPTRECSLAPEAMRYVDSPRT